MRPITLTDEKPTLQNTIAWKIRHSLYQEQIGQLVLFVGKSGGGKSWSAGHLCELVDPTYTAEERVVFTARDFLRLIKSGLPVGSAILFDEAGKDIGSRTFMKRDQVSLMVFIQAMRKLRYLVCFTVPSRRFVDTQLRDMAHILCEYKRKDTNKSCIHFKVKFNNFRLDPFTNNPIYTYPVVYVNGQLKRVVITAFGKPSIKWQHAYEKVKDENIMKLAEPIENAAVPRNLRTAMDKRNEIKEIEALAIGVEENLQNYIDTKGKIDWRLIKLENALSDSKAQLVVSLLKRRPKFQEMIENKLNPASDSPVPVIKRRHATIYHNVR